MEQYSRDIFYYDDKCKRQSIKKKFVYFLGVEHLFISNSCTPDLKQKDS